MATTWLPYREFVPERKKWLLKDGTVLDEPVMQQSNAGRRLRVPATGQSAFNKDFSSLMLQAADTIAHGRGTEVWFPLNGHRQALEEYLGFDPEETRASLHTLNRDDLLDRTQVWFEFRHPTLPIEAYLVVDAGRTRNSASAPHKVETSLTTANTRPVRALDGEQTILRTSDPKFWEDDAYDGHSPNWDTTLLSEVIFHTEGPMIQHVLSTVDLLNDVETLQIPDLRNPNKPGWLDLEFTDTNLNGDFLSDLKEYLEGQPTLQRAADLYSELRDTLRSLGVVLPVQTVDDFSRGLLGGALEVPVGVVRKDVDEVDDQHALIMDLTSGTFVVNCSVAVRNDTDIAYAWNEAKTIASLSGEEPELLAFARETARRQTEDRARGIIRARRKSQRKT